MITSDAITPAEPLFGVNCTPAERARMLGNLEGQIASAVARRRVAQGLSPWGRLFDEGPMLTLGMALEQALGVAAARPGFPV